MLSLQSFESSQSTSGQKPHQFHQQTTARSHFASHITSCLLCTENHYLYQCNSFLTKTTQQRRDYASLSKLCFNCLGNHKFVKCQSLKRCRKCGKNHHTLLHFSEQSARTELSEGQTNKRVNYTCYRQEKTTTVLLATVQLVIAGSNGQKYLIYALLDQESEISLISEGQKSSISVIGVGEGRAGRTRGKVNLSINPHFDSSVDIDIQAFILPKLTSVLPSSDFAGPISWDHVKNLQLADPDYKLQKQIDLIIGADYYGHLLEGSIIKGPNNAPVAQLTKLEWILSGPVNVNPKTKASVAHCSVDWDLNKTLEKFWIQEELPHRTKRSLSPEDQMCENHFQLTHQRDLTGRYILRLPFKASLDQLGNSIIPSQRALHHLSSKFEKNTEYANEYAAFINEYKVLNHMTRVPDQEHDPKSVFYLPHHGVSRESSTTTKLRVVFNGSCRLPQGKPLNELLCTGAKMQIDIFDVLLWFRKFRYVFSADIEKMYRQIKSHPEDWHFQRILWKENAKTVKYQLTTVTYGLAWAPFQALRTIGQLIHDEGRKYPQAIDILTYGRYVDDLFGGSDNTKDAQEKTTHVRQLCMAGGFPLKKWVSNHRDILEKIPVEDQAQQKSIRLQDETVRALGLFWNRTTDELLFKYSPPPPTIISKRTVLSRIAQIYDPLGLLSPIFIKLKIFMQELWAIKLTWDEQLPAGQLNTWIQLQNLLKGLDYIRVPRWIGLISSSDIEIHGFCDGSQAAMAAVVFVRTSDNSAITSNLLCSKTKVAPLKRMTIPRLELSAAMMLSKLVRHCQQVLQLDKSPCHLWTDSTIVHTWISNRPSKWKDFVHNRVCCIQVTLPSAQWHHIDGKSNPADCATRGLSARDLKSHSPWWSGSEWLLQHCSHWPKETMTPINNEDLEVKPVSAHHAVVTRSWDLMSRYSSWRKLVSITACMHTSD